MSLKTPDSLLLKEGDLSRDGWSASFNKLHRMWFELLALSPSYELARRYRHLKGRLNESDRQRLPADFERVVQVYDDFGDVQNLLFRQWWLQRGLKLLGSQGDHPKTALLFKVNGQQPLTNDDLRRTRHHFSTVWSEAHQPDVAVIAVPLNIGRQKALRQVKKLIDRHAVALFQPPTPKYQLEDKDMHIKSLKDAVSVLYMRAAKPDFRLWQIGVKSDISKSYSNRFDVRTTKRTSSNSEELRHLEMMTSRKYRQARFLAENAARGIFPSMRQPPYMVDFDPAEFNQIIKEKLKWKMAEISRLQRGHPEAQQA